jgi:hypothetical protein
VDVQQQGVEAFNPYQFAFNNPLVYSDPSGLFTLIELNANISTQDILSAIKSESYQQFKSYAKDKIGEALGNAFGGFIKKLLPFADSGFMGKLDGTKGGGGTPFEKYLNGQICGIFNALGGEFVNNLWIEPSVNSQDGSPTADGINCIGLFNKQIDISGKGSRPDFIYKEGTPTAKDNKTNKAYVIGDIKVSMSKVFKEIGVDGNPKNQWIAMRKYAKDYVYGHIVMYTTLKRNEKGSVELNDNKVLAAKLAQAYKASVEKGVILIIVNLMD